MAQPQQWSLSGVNGVTHFPRKETVTLDLGTCFTHPDGHLPPPDFHLHGSVFGVSMQTQTSGSSLSLRAVYKQDWFWAWQWFMPFCCWILSRCMITSTIVQCLLFGWAFHSCSLGYMNRAARYILIIKKCLVWLPMLRCAPFFQNSLNIYVFL